MTAQEVVQTYSNPSFLWWLIFMVVMGAGLYLVDRRFGTGIYRWWYDLTSKKPLAADIERGFIYGRKARGRFSLAVFLGILHSIVAVCSCQSHRATLHVYR
jgi:hypothetical protein